MQCGIVQRDHRHLYVLDYTSDKDAHLYTFATVITCYYSPRLTTLHGPASRRVPCHWFQEHRNPPRFWYKTTLDTGLDRYIYYIKHGNHPSKSHLYVRWSNEHNWRARPTEVAVPFESVFTRPSRAVEPATCERHRSKRRRVLSESEESTQTNSNPGEWSNRHQ